MKWASFQPLSIDLYLNPLNLNSFTSYFQEMPVKPCTSVLLQYLVVILLRITSALPSIPNPDAKAAFDQILQANLEIERDCKFLFREEKSLRHVPMVSKFLDDNKPKTHLKSEFALF